MLFGVKPLKLELSSVFACLLRSILNLLHHICPLSFRLSVPPGGDPGKKTFYLELVVLILTALCTLTVSHTAAVNDFRLPRSCLLDVAFSPSYLGAIQVTLPDLHIDCFMILCNTFEPEMNYQGLSTEHLLAFPHMLPLTARFYPLS